MTKRAIELKDMYKVQGSKQLLRSLYFKGRVPIHACYISGKIDKTVSIFMGENMLSERMNRAYQTIENEVFQYVPPVYWKEIFSSKMSASDIVLQIMVECCKYAYDYTAPKHSINYYLTDDLDYDAERMKIKRTKDYVFERRRIQFENISKERGYTIKDSTDIDMNDSKIKFEGYKFNEFQFWELTNVHDTLLVKDIVDRKICNKNYKFDKFVEHINDYDYLIDGMCNNELPFDNKFLNMLGIFVLEWKYSVDFLYEIVAKMVNENVGDINRTVNRIKIFFCGITGYHPIIQGGLGREITMENRMLTIRRKYIDDIVCASDAVFEKDKFCFLEGSSIVGTLLTNMRLFGEPIREWFKNHTTEEDWITVFDEYKVTDLFEDEKCWDDRKQLRYLKEIYRQISFDYKS